MSRAEEELQSGSSDEEVGYGEEVDEVEIALVVGDTWPTALAALEDNVLNATKFLLVLEGGVIVQMAAAAPNPRQAGRLVRLLVERSFAPMRRRTRRIILSALVALVSSGVDAVAGALVKNVVNVRGVRQHAFIVACGCAIGPAVAEAAAAGATPWLATFAAAHLGALGALGIDAGSTRRSASAQRTRRAAVSSIKSLLALRDGALYSAYYAAGLKLYAKAAAKFERRRGAAELPAPRADPGFGVGLALHTVLAVAAERAELSGASEARTSGLALFVETAIGARRAAAALPPLQAPRSGAPAASEWDLEPAGRVLAAPAAEASAAAASECVEPFAPLLARLTHEDLATVVPALCAALRAHPAAVLPLAIRTARIVPTGEFFFFSKRTVL